MHLDLVSLTGLPLAFTFCRIPLRLPCARSSGPGCVGGLNLSSLCYHLRILHQQHMWKAFSSPHMWGLPTEVPVKFLIGPSVLCCKQNFNLRLSKLHFLVRACASTTTAPIRWALSGRSSEAAGFHPLFCPDWMNYLNDRAGLGIGRPGMKARHTATDSLAHSQTHSPDPEFSELSQVNALVIDCLGQFPEHQNGYGL